MILYVQKEILKDVIISHAGLCFPGDLKLLFVLFLEGLQILTAYGLSSHMKYMKTNMYVEWKNVSLKRQPFLKILIPVAKALFGYIN